MYLKLHLQLPVQALKQLEGRKITFIQILKLYSIHMLMTAQLPMIINLFPKEDYYHSLEKQLHPSSPQHRTHLTKVQLWWTRRFFRNRIVKYQSLSILKKSWNLKPRWQWFLICMTSLKQWLSPYSANLEPCHSCLGFSSKFYIKSAWASTSKNTGSKRYLFCFLNS